MRRKLMNRSPPALRRWAALPALAACLLIGGCGGDEEPPAEDQIREVLTENLTATNRTEVECEGTVTDDYLDRVYGGQDACRDLVDDPETEITSNDELDFEAIDINGDQAAVQVEIRGGALQGVGGGLELVNDEERGWLLDRFDGDFARTSVISSLRAQLDPNISLCVEDALFGPGVSDGDAQDLFVAISRGDEDAIAQTDDVIAECARLVGNGRANGDGDGGGGGKSAKFDPKDFDRGGFEQSLEESLTSEQGLTDAAARCVIDRLERTLRNREANRILKSAAQRKSPPERIIEKVDRAARRCLAKEKNGRRS